MIKHIFMASTPFNVITASMIAFELPENEQAILWLIDQIPGHNFKNYLKEWKTSPFESISVISEQQKGAGKFRYRRKVFSSISHQLSEIRPHHIYTGNDRRLEFQFAMSVANSYQQTLGHYIDDGTYSYIGRKTHWLKDGLIDNLIKKLAYGFWWSQPATVGASRWISQSWLAYPEAAVPELQCKPIRQLPKNLHRSEFTELATIGLPADFDLTGIDGVLLLPHDSVGPASTANSLINWLQQQDGVECIAIKNHPRSRPKKTDSNPTVTEIPASIPMEILLPLLPSGCLVAGTLSTALLTAKWLRPDLTVYAHLQDTVSTDWQRLLRKIGVIIIGTVTNAS